MVSVWVSWTVSATATPAAKMNTMECFEGRTVPMGKLTICNLEESTKNRLRLHAVPHGRSMVEEAHFIVRQAVTESPAAEVREGVGSRIQNNFACLGGVEMELPNRAAHPFDQPFA
jgi:plasmid stability protein